MTVELELTVVQAATDLGYLVGFAITDQMIHVVGGTSSQCPTVLTSSNGRHFERRKTPRDLGLRDVLAIGDAVWICGEYGQLAVSADQGASWRLIETGTESCLHGLSLAPDGAIWVVGDRGVVLRVIGERVERIELDTTVRMSAAYMVRDEVVLLGFDGVLRRWKHGVVTLGKTGSGKPLTGFVLTKRGTWIVTGDGGFISRSPDGAWWSRAPSGVDVDLEACAMLEDGRVVIVGDQGQILMSADDGRSWQRVASPVSTHLWSVERFGEVLLVGGDDGFIARLAPPGDVTWEDRVDVFGGAKPFDLRFAAGPDGFIAKGLATFMDAMEQVAPDEDDDDDDDDDEDDDDDDGNDDDDGDDDDDDDDEDDDDDDDDGGGVQVVIGGDREAFEALGASGDAASFEANYGVAMPPEAVAFYKTVLDRDHDPDRSFHELRIDNQVLPDVGTNNLFELIVRRDQRAHLGTGLVEALCGVFCVGLQDNGDTYHMELYEWDGPRQVLHYDHEDRTFTGVFSDSLDSLIYLTSLYGAERADKISKDAFHVGLRKLRGRISPTWQFAIDDHDPAFESLEPKRRDTEFFFYRSRWIYALLKNDGATDGHEVAQLFNADFNQIVPQDQLAARFDACEKFIPTALYSMWRAVLFDEPELARYLEIGRRHKARLVRDAAALIDELRAGRNELGTIRDVRAHLAAFRALDLDPRRAEQRRAEAEARTKLEALRKDDVVGELEATPPAGWGELAWRWLGDGIAHRMLLERLDTAPTTAAQIAALDELRALTDHDREITVPLLAAELAPELEALLVGSLVRDDGLEGVLTRPASSPHQPGTKDDAIEDDEDDDEEEDDDDDAPGWAAIDRALEPLYHGVEPHAHIGTVLPYALGGNDPIHGISVYLRTEPPHFHFVTYGFSDLFRKETDDPHVSGFGFELTFRLARTTEDEVPIWALNFLQNLGRYVFGTGNSFEVGHKMSLNGPIAAELATPITAIMFANDPELGEISSEFGAATFLQVVGLTDDEYKLTQEWSSIGVLDILNKRLPMLVTELQRESVLADPAIALVVKKRVELEGSSEEIASAGDLRVAVTAETVRIDVGALYAGALPRAMRGRIRHGRSYRLQGREQVLVLTPGVTAQARREGSEVTLEIPPDVASEIDARLRAGLAGEFRFELWPALRIVVTPSFIRDPSGRAIEVRGVVDPEVMHALMDAENARLDAGAADDDDGSDTDDDDDDELDDTPPDPDRVREALRLTERARRMSPDDRDVQFTHAMLLLDGESAGVPGMIDTLLRDLPKLEASVRINVAVRMGKSGHARFADAVDAVLSDVLPDTIIGDRAFSVGTASVTSYGDVAEELFTELAESILEHAPGRLGRLIPILPAEVNLLAQLAYKAIRAGERDHALALYDRVLALPIPEVGEPRANYLRSLNNACVQAHAVKAFDAAARIADRAQPVAHENPYIYHAAACAYAAVGDLAKAFQQIKLAVEHDYDHLTKVETDADLGPLLEWPEFKALFRDWHARQEGN